MASLRKRKETYYIRFFTHADGKRKQKALSLGTSIKREAEKLLIKYEEMFERGEIDPFNGWTPKKEAEKKRKSLKGKYMTLQDASDLFVKNRSQANQQTKDNYERHLNMLQNELGSTMPVTEIMEQDIRDFCFRKDLAPATQASYLRHYKVFFRWLHKKQIVKENITDGVKAPRVPQNISEKMISRKQLDLLFEKFDEFTKRNEKAGYITKPHQKRHWFKPMISTYYYCGLRAKEGVKLTWEDVDMSWVDEGDDSDSGYIRIINKNGLNTKTGKDRTIPIRKKLKPILKEWHEFLGKPKDGYVFPSATGLNRFQKMSPGAVSRSFKKFVREAELPESITLHGLRHSCATEMLRKGAPFHQVRDFLGHSSVEVTQIYEHLDETDLKRTLDAIE